MKGKLVGWLLVILVAAVLCRALLPTFEGVAGEESYTENAFEADDGEFQVNNVAKPRDLESLDDTQDVSLENKQNDLLDTTEQDILGATVRIIMVALLEGNGEVLSNLPIDHARTLMQAGRGYATASGLGTVVTSQNQTFIITHGHWGELLADADLVKLLDANSNLLLELTNTQFRSLLRYQDSGLMVLNAPHGLWLKPAALGNSQAVRAGQRLQVVRQQSGNTSRLEVVTALVSATGSYKYRAASMLQLPSGVAIQPGDSGGGIWLDGRLVGDLWAVKLTVDTHGNAWTWDTLKADEIVSCDAYAAQFPNGLLASLGEGILYDVGSSSSALDSSRRDTLDQ